MDQTSSTDAPPEEAPPTFDALPLSPEVRRAVDDLGYTHPTPVQRAVFESVAAGRDVVVQARTGTGKTAAFGLPVIDRLVDVSAEKPQVLVLSPTRELALQIHRELTNLGKHRNVSCTAIYGGAPMQPQVDAIKSGAQIIAGTPGRVLDHLERGTLKPKSLVALVLDESDEMLSMGFLPQITKIMERLPKGHQTLLFSATLPPDVKRIADSRLTDPEFITLSGDHVGALSIDHFIYRSSGNKTDELISVIEVENPESAIVFCNTRDQTKRLATALQKKGFAADWLNADLAQKDREKVMAATRESKLRFLVCTDVAARGIDISHLTHVINADFPESTENYVHRTGRTGRAGRTGTAISLITPQDVGNLYMLRLTYKIFPVERDLPRPAEVQTRRETDLVAFLHDAFSAQALSEADRSIARRILTSDFAETVVAGLLHDHLGAHPGADERAADARRQAPPAATEEPPKKKKKSKKKRKKDEEPTPTPALSDSPLPAEDLARPATTEKPTSDASSTASVKLSEDSSHDSSQGATATQVTEPSEELEVISASELLDESERALLAGNDVHEDSPRPRPRGRVRSDPSEPKHAEPKQDDGTPKVESRRIYVNLGARDEVTEEDFLDTLADNGFSLSSVLKVRVKNSHTLLTVLSESFDAAVRALDGEDVGGLDAQAEEARPPRRRNKT